MVKNRKLLLVVPILVFVLACQAVTRVWEAGPALLLPTASPTATWSNPLEVRSTTIALASTSTPLPPSPTNTAAALTRPSTRTPRPTATATVTPPDTATAAPTFTPTGPTPTPLTKTLQLNVFEKLWKTVKDNYLYPDFNGLDWDTIHTEYRQKIESGLSNGAFYQALGEMIYRLKDDHSVFLSPDEVKRQEAEFSGNTSFVGIGVLVLAVPERQRAVILIVFRGSPAEQAGLKSHDNLLTVDGQPILDENGVLRDILRGPVGTQVTLSVQTPGQEPRQLTINRRPISAPVPVPYQVLRTASGKRVGYLLITTFADGTISDQVGAALRAMSADGPLNGVIIDNRMNEGGTNTMLEGTLSYFTHGKLGDFVARDQTDPLQIMGKDISGSQEVPLVVLVGKNTVSFGEIFSGVLKDTGRAHLIGETTAGNVEILWGYDFQDGSRAWIAHEYFRPLNHPDQKWEGVGIIPDETVVTAWDLYTVETDPAVNAGLEYLDTQ